MEPLLSYEVGEGTPFLPGHSSRLATPSGHPPSSSSSLTSLRASSLNWFLSQHFSVIRFHWRKVTSFYFIFQRLDLSERMKISEKKKKTFLGHSLNFFSTRASFSTVNAVRCGETAQWVHKLLVYIFKGTDSKLTLIPTFIWSIHMIRHLCGSLNKTQYWDVPKSENKQIITILFFNFVDSKKISSYY